MEASNSQPETAYHMLEPAELSFHSNLTLLCSGQLCKLKVTFWSIPSEIQRINNVQINASNVYDASQHMNLKASKSNS